MRGLRGGGGGKKGLGMPRLIGREFVGKRDEMERCLGLVEGNDEGLAGWR